MDLLIFILVMAAFWFIAIKMPFVSKSGLTKKETSFLFLLNIAAGVLFGYLTLHWYGAEADSWDFNRQGINEHQWLRNDPKAFIIDLVGDRYQNGYGGLFSSSRSFWNDFNDNFIIKWVATFNFIARGNYYTNAIPFCFIAFLGHTALFRIFSQLYNNKKLVIAGCFLLPSTLLFTAAVSKDSIAFFSLSVLLFVVFKIIHQKQHNFFNYCTALIFFFIFFLFKNHYAVLLLPAIAAWATASAFSKNKWLAFTAVYGICVLLFFTINKIIPAINPPQIICNSQKTFLQLPKGTTEIALDTLKPGFSSFVANAPQAIGHALLRPHAAEIKIRSLIPAALEIVLYQVLLLLFIFYRKKNDSKAPVAFILFLLFYVFSCLMLTGYISSNLNTIFRYRSLFWPLIITPLLCSIDVKKLPVLYKL